MNKIKTKPIFIEKIWGGRSLKRLFNKSIPKGKRIGESWELYDKKIPIVVKLIDVKEPLSIQVHPRGKSELWYIIEAGKESRAIGGINLKEYKIKKGTWIYIPNGTAHTIFPPAVLLEISQNKLITYRLFDWGRKKRKLDVEKALSVLNPESKLRIYNNIKSFNCPYFKVKFLKLNKDKIYNRAENVYFVLKGKIKVGQEILKKGDTVLATNKCSIEILSSSEIFKISY